MKIARYPSLHRPLEDLQAFADDDLLLTANKEGSADEREGLKRTMCAMAKNHSEDIYLDPTGTRRYLV